MFANSLIPRLLTSLRPQFAFSLKPTKKKISSDVMNPTTETKKIERNPEEASAFLKEAISFHESQNLEKAIFYYSRSIQKDDQNPIPLLNSGIAYASLRNHMKAIEYFEKYIVSKPSDPTVYKYLAQSLFHMNDLEKAIKCYHIALAKITGGSSDPVLYFNLSAAYERSADALQKDVEDSEESSLKQAADTKKPINTKSIQKQREDYLEKAQLLLMKAISLNPKFIDAHNNLGSLYLQQGNVRAAKESIQKALEINPNFANALFNLSLVYQQEQNIPMEIETLEKAKLVDVNNGQIYFNLARIYAKTGEEQKAKENLAISESFIKE